MTRFWRGKRNDGARELAERLEYEIGIMRKDLAGLVETVQSMRDQPQIKRRGKPKKAET